MSFRLGNVIDSSMGPSNLFLFYFYICSRNNIYKYLAKVLYRMAINT